MVWLLLLLFQADQFEVEVLSSPADTPAFVVDVPSGPSIEFQSAPKSAASEPYFALFSQRNCGPCKRMADDKIVEALETAGYQVRKVDIDKEPQPTVKTVPQLWLCGSDKKPIRKWIGYTTAAQALTPVAVDGVCRLSADGKYWSGVVVAPGFVLTVAHHEKTEGFVAELPKSFGSADYARISCTLVKSDIDADLSLLRFEPVDLVQVKDYPLSKLPASAIEITGYLSGKDPRKVKICRNANRGFKIAGIAMDSYDGEGISSPQFGMSGSPLLTPSKEIAGIQSIGSAQEIGAVSLDTIRDFLNGVDLQSESPVAATIHGAQLNPEVIAAALATHLAEQSGAEPPAFASLFDVSVDVPDSARGWIADLLTAQSVDFPSSGVSVSWKGSDRTISVAPGRLAIKPGASVSITKFRVQVTASLDAVAYAEDLSWVTLELGGAPDLTVRLK
jgi:hypothetical protein